MQRASLSVLLALHDDIFASTRQVTVYGIAQQVRSTGRPKALEPMNPYERRIIHSALQKSSYVTTQSEGEEPNRRVVISPKRRQNRQNRGA